MARSDHSHDDDEMLKVIMMMLNVLPNIFQVACGGKSVGNKPGCVAWQQGFFVSFYQLTSKREEVWLLNMFALDTDQRPKKAHQTPLLFRSDRMETLCNAPACSEHGPGSSFGRWQHFASRRPGAMCIHCIVVFLCVIAPG